MIATRCKNAAKLAARRMPNYPDWDSKGARGFPIIAHTKFLNGLVTEVPNENTHQPPIGSTQRHVTREIMDHFLTSLRFSILEAAIR